VPMVAVHCDEVGRCSLAVCPLGFEVHMGWDKLVHVGEAWVLERVLGVRIENLVLVVRRKGRRRMEWQREVSTATSCPEVAAGLRHTCIMAKVL
jgi:hypothetical protein